MDTLPRNTRVVKRSCRRGLPTMAVLAMLCAAANAAWSADEKQRAGVSQPLSLALDGRTFYYLGITMRALHVGEVSDPELLDTLTAMTLNGVIIFLAGSLMESRGTSAMRPAAWVLVVISPFAILQPLGILVATGEYSLRYDWFYLALALTTAVLAHYRQRKSFYLAGLLNTGLALFFLTQHHEWWDVPEWAVFVVVTGLLLFGVGFELYLRERTRKRLVD